MKLLILLLLPTLLLAQSKEIKVYDTTNGIQDFIPSIIIEIAKDDIKIFETQNGVKEILPIQIIEGNKIYETTNGIKDVNNFKTIEVPLIVE